MDFFPPLPPFKMDEKRKVRSRTSAWNVTVFRKFFSMPDAIPEFRVARTRRGSERERERENKALRNGRINYAFDYDSSTNVCISKHVSRRDRIVHSFFARCPFAKCVASVAGVNFFCVYVQRSNLKLHRPSGVANDGEAIKDETGRRNRNTGRKFNFLLIRVKCVFSFSSPLEIN